MGVRQREGGVNHRVGAGERTVDWAELSTLNPVRVTELLNPLKQ